jgi:Asp-tRNA(Asn)/Glu-tRNA(Gln) amidotransferase A subunit family amidase
MTSSLLDIPIKTLIRRIHSGSLDPLAVVRCSLARVRRSNGRIHSFIAVANGVSTATEGSKSGVLAGVPFSVKDNIDVAGFVTTCGWPQWSNLPAIQSAGLVRKLQQVGAVAIGKTNMPPLAFGATGKNEFYGTVLNPMDEAFTTSGSSSGSAASVAAALVSFALASDTTGSARTPAALCGIVGLRPEKGRADTSGLTTRSPTLDRIGIMTRTTSDLASVWDALESGSENESAKTPEFHLTAAARRNDTGARSPSQIHVITSLPDSLGNRVDAETDDAFRRALEAISLAGFELIFAEFPDFDVADEAARVISEFEPAIKYGHLLSSSQDHNNGLPPSVHCRLTQAQSIDLAEYNQALVQMRNFDTALSSLLANPGSVLITPAAPKPRYAVGEEFPKLRRDRQTAFTRPLSLYSGAVAVVPRRVSGLDVVPPAIQVAARTTRELLVFFDICRHFTTMF